MKITTQQINKLILETNGCLYVNGSCLGKNYNPRILRVRTKKGILQFQSYAPNWFTIPTNATFMDGRTGKIII